MADTERDIPEESRRLVEERDNKRCFNCLGPGSDWHHRRSRRVRADHRHCPCNGVLLCRTCHRWAHSDPDLSRPVGLVVSQWVDEPFMIPLGDRLGHWWQVLCTGEYRQLNDRQVMTDGFGGFVVAMDAEEGTDGR